MKYKLLVMFAVLILSIGAVSALDDNSTQDIIMSTGNETEIGISLPDGGTFEDIQSAIDNSNEGDTVKLNGNFHSTGNVISVDKSITIDGGKNTVLDAGKISGFFSFREDNKKITLTGLKFINGKGFEGEIHDYYGLSSSYIIKDCVFENNPKIFITMGDNNYCTISGCSFKNNQKVGISSDGGNIVNSRFENNNDLEINMFKEIVSCVFNRNNGYHMICDVGLVKKCSFTGNVLKGSLIYNVKRVDTSKFTSNTIESDGLIWDVVKVTYSDFTGNYAKKHDDWSGCGACIMGANSVIGCNFKNNKADIEGGAIYSADNVDKCTFENNRAGGNGGAICSVDSVSNSVFKNNYAKCNGGAISEVSSLYNCKFIKNEINGKIKNYKMGGGGAVATYSNLKVDKCFFKDNKAGSSGSAIFIMTILNYDDVVIKNTKFVGNTAKGDFETVGYSFTNYGNGLIYVMGNHNFKMTFKNCKGIGKNKDKFKTKTKISIFSKGNYLIVKVGDKDYNNPIKHVKVKITLDGRTFTKTTDNKGHVIIVLKSKLNSLHKVKVRFRGDNFNIASSKNSKISVKKATPKIASKGVASKKFKVLLTAGGAGIKKVKLVLKINGKKFSAKTNSKGIATFKLSKSGKFTGKVIFKGNKYFSKTSKNVKIRVR